MKFRSSVLFALTIVSIVGSEGCKKKSSQADVALRPEASNVAEVLSVTKRPDKVPDFTWKDSTGATVSYDQVRGKVTLINFWATWCGPCKKELPALSALSRELRGRGVRIIGISSDRGANIIDDVRAFVRENGLQYQIVVSNDDLEEAFGNIRQLPTSFLVDEDGKIVKTFVGGRDKEFFAAAIDPLLK